MKRQCVSLVRDLRAWTRRTFKPVPALTTYVPTSQQFSNSSVTMRPFTELGSGCPGRVVLTDNGLIFDRIAVPAKLDQRTTDNENRACTADGRTHSRSFCRRWTNSDVGTGWRAQGPLAGC